LRDIVSAWSCQYWRYRRCFYGSVEWWAVNLCDRDSCRIRAYRCTHRSIFLDVDSSRSANFVESISIRGLWWLCRQGLLFLKRGYRGRLVHSRREIVCLIIKR